VFTTFTTVLSLLSLSFQDWFAAGKGPNPDVASLDREMDDYFKSKPAGEQLENEAST
jgi:hypothetical protein